MATTIETKVIENTVVDGSGSFAGLPKHSAIGLDGTGPAVKIMHCLAKDTDGMLHYQVFLEELYNDATNGYGDNDKFNNLTNGTMTDLNGNTARTVVASKCLNAYASNSKGDV